METCWKGRSGNVECRERSLWRLAGRDGLEMWNVGRGVYGDLLEGTVWECGM